MMAQYIIEPKKTLKKWVKPHVQTESLSNFEYVYYRTKNIDIYKLSHSNTIMAKTILKQMPDKINYNSLSFNSSKWAYKLLDKIDTHFLSKNPSKWGRKMLKNTKIDWYMLTQNTSRWAYKILKSNPHNINYVLSKNPSKWAYKLLDKIEWLLLSENPSDWARKLLRPNIINWGYLSKNPSKWAYKLLKNKPYMIDWEFFSSNPYIFNIVKTNYKLFDVLLHKKLI